MAWRRPGDKPLSEPRMESLLTHICVTRPQWVNLCMLKTPRNIKFITLIFIKFNSYFSVWHMWRIITFCLRCLIFFLHKSMFCLHTLNLRCGISKHQGSCEFRGLHGIIGDNWYNLQAVQNPLTKTVSTDPKYWSKTITIIHYHSNNTGMP